MAGRTGEQEPSWLGGRRRDHLAMTPSCHTQGRRAGPPPGCCWLPASRPCWAQRRARSSARPALSMRRRRARAARCGIVRGAGDATCPSSGWPGSSIVRAGVPSCSPAGDGVDGELLRLAPACGVRRRWLTPGLLWRLLGWTRRRRARPLRPAAAPAAPPLIAWPRSTTIPSPCLNAAQMATALRLPPRRGSARRGPGRRCRSRAGRRPGRFACRPPGSAAPPRPPARLVAPGGVAAHPAGRAARRGQGGGGPLPRGGSLPALAGRQRPAAYPRFLVCPAAGGRPARRAHPPAGV